MNKRLQMTAIAMVLAATSFGAFADDTGAFFINGNLGQADYHDNSFNNKDTVASGALRVGYTWQSPVVDFGVETGYVDLGKATGSANYDGYNETYSARIDGTLLGMNLKYKFGNNWFISGRAGYFRSQMRFKANLNIPYYADQSFSQKYSGDGGYAGVGVGYDITPHFSIGASYDNYYARVKVNGSGENTTVGVFSGFAEYRF
ncbi:MAG: outer membrane beta-barrel protein [Rhodanobacter sp.]